MKNKLNIDPTKLQIHELVAVYVALQVSYFLTLDGIKLYGHSQHFCNQKQNKKIAQPISEVINQTSLCI